MRFSFAVIVAALPLAGCLQQSDLDAANKKLAAANATIEAANASLAIAKKAAYDFKAQLNDAQAQIDRLNAQLAAKPKLPLTMTVNKAIPGPGLVAVFNATKPPSAVHAIIRNPAWGTIRQVDLHMDPMHPANPGAMEGVVVYPGDEITLTNNDYSPVTFAVR
jgi:multidrug resistance efflux pump